MSTSDCPGGNRNFNAYLTLHLLLLYLKLPITIVSTYLKTVFKFVKHKYTVAQVPLKAVLKLNTAKHCPLLTNATLQVSC